MLHDSRLDRFPTLMRFIAWLRTKPADETYEWWNGHGCACAQFFGRRDWIELNSEVCFAEGVNLNHLAFGCVRWTYGGLLERAERKLEELCRDREYLLKQMELFDA